ncbi:MAG: leucine-rich repeat domain-containing protein [Dysgonomonas sp.]
MLKANDSYILYWKLDDATNTLFIDGDGELRGYYFGENPPWYGFYVKTAIIGENITSIGGNVFNGKYLTTLYFNPINCTHMGDNTFPAISKHNNSISLTSLIIGNKTTNIPSYAFFGCNNLNSVTIPQKVVSIGESAFSGCSSLKEVNFNATNCESGGFLECTSLEKVIIGTEVTNIPDAAFAGCHNLDSIILPNSVTHIGQKAFYDCRSLTSITLPSNLKTIKNSTFFGCKNLTSISIPDKIKTIGLNALGNCSGLAEIISLNPIPPTTAQFENVPTSTCLLKIPEKSHTAYKIANGWKDFLNIIDDQPMQNPTGFCGDNLTWTLNLSSRSLTIEGIGEMTDYSNTNTPWYLYQNFIKIVEIENGLTNLGGNTFSDYSLLETINVNSSNTSYSSFDGSLFDKEKTVLIMCPPARLSVTIPESVDSIGENAFVNCINLIELNYNAISCRKMGYVSLNGLPGLGGDYYFVPLLKECKNLTTINIGSEVENIPIGAFSDCEGLTTVNFNAANCIKTGGSFQSADWLIGSIFVSIFKGCEKLITINIGNKVQRIPDNAFRSCKNIASITIPNNVATIGDYTFYGCEALTSITLGNSLENIGNSAFYGCSALSHIASLNLVPPSITWNNTFDGVNRNYCKLSVLAGSKTSYQIANGWKDFLNISELPIVDENIEIKTQNNSASISWVASSDAANYTLSVYSDANRTQTVADFYLDAGGNIIRSTAVSPILSCTINDLDLLTTYYFSLIAYNENAAAIGISNGSFETKESSGIETEDLDLSKTLFVYPNPVSDYFYISGVSMSMDLVLLDINGKIILQKTIEPDERISIEYLPKGIYLVCVRDKILKIIKY